MGGWNFAPEDWALCNGAVLAISQNTTLFELIGTTYGGDGQTTFQLPDLQCRFPMHMGTGRSGTSYVEGQNGGVETVTLATGQIPIHNHVPVASTGDGTSNLPTNNYWANWTGAQYNTTVAGSAPMRSDVVGTVGGGQAHDNMIPYLAVTFVIALYGIYPSQS
jgi:microcystin-dependent protein